MDPHELQQNAVYPHPLCSHQQPVTAEHVQEHLRLKLQQRPRHDYQQSRRTASTKKKAESRLHYDLKHGLINFKR